MNPHPHLAAAVMSFFEEAAVMMETTDWLNPCPVMTVAAEVADSEPGLRAVAAEVVEMWESQGAAYFESCGVGRDDAAELAPVVIAALEGAFVLCRTRRSAAPLRAAGRAVEAYVAALPVARPISKS